MLEEVRVVELEVGESPVVGEVNRCGWGPQKSFKATTFCD